MTINQAEPIIYERLENGYSPAAAERKEAKFPTLFWAGTTLFAVNVLILFGMWLTPELRVGVYGIETDGSNSLYKPSPFAEVVETKPVPPVKMAEKMRPVIYQEPEPMDEVQAAELQLPRATFSSVGVPNPAAAASAASKAPVSISLTGASVEKVIDSYSDFPRVTASLNRAVATEPVHATTLDVTPRRVSERAVRTAIN